MERSEIVLKKFGLLDRDFHLRPFLVSLLTEQIAGYYDNKTKTVNLLDWIAPDEQKPVLAHELTHALQDQKVDLAKWSDQSKQSIAKNVDEDNEHLQDGRGGHGARSGGRRTGDGGLPGLHAGADGTDAGRAAGHRSATGRRGRRRRDSPVMARAPLLLQESLLFPYSEGLGFEQVVSEGQGRRQAFAGVLDGRRRPATRSCIRERGSGRCIRRC